MRKLPSVKLDNFEGPFDLLVELSRKRKLDISAVSLGQITDDFLRYLNEHTLPANVIGDFLVTAATLLLIKTRLIAPTLSAQEEEEVMQLTQRLKIYQLYRDQGVFLRSRWSRLRLYRAFYWSEFRRQPDSAASFPPLHADELSLYMSQVIKKLPAPVRPRAHLTVFGRTLSQCIELFKERLHKAKQFSFDEATGGYDRQDKAVSFLAVLEMVKRCQVEIRQKHPFDNMLIKQIHNQQANE